MWILKQKSNLFLVLFLALVLPFSAFCSDTKPLEQADLDLMTRAELEQIVLIYDKALMQSQKDSETNKQNWLNLATPLRAVQSLQTSQASTLETLSIQLEKYEIQQKKDKVQNVIDKVVLAITSVGITALIFEIAQ